MRKFWQLFKGKEKEEKLLEAIQIEVSALCNSSCIFCPTTYHQNQAKDTMDLEVFNKLVPYFSRTNWVYMQGWGEPLLHKDFWEMVHLAKIAGVQVGFTTDGTLLNPSAIDSIFATGVDQITISIAGATEETHGKLRVGTNLELIGTNIKMLLEKRKLCQSNRIAKPKITVSYMLTKDNIHELSDALKLAMGWGVDDFYTTHIDYVFDNLTNNQKIYYCIDGDQESIKKMVTELRPYQEYIDAANEVANNGKFLFNKCKLIFKEQNASCDLNPLKFIFITASGDVTPCANLARTENIKVFGNIKQLNLDQILASEGYREFCKPFEKREVALAKLLYVYGDCEPSLVRIQQADEEYNEQMKKHSLPKSCQVCPKSFGV